MRSIQVLLCLFCLSSWSFAGTAEDPFAGKSLDKSSTVSEEPLVPFVSNDLPGSVHALPQLFTTLRHAVDFIHQQRGLGGLGLPATFYVPSGVRFGDPLRHLIISEGVGLYDTALAVIILVEAGDLKTAQELLDIYKEGQYSMKSQVPMELRAYPTLNNGGAYSTFDDQTHYFFDFTNVYGEWMRWRTRWEFWAAHTGPNAWLTNALVRFIVASKSQGQSDLDLKPYVDLARMLGDAMIRLQDSAALGGVRYGPENEYVLEGAAAPYDQINSENNVSAYVAFQMLFELTRDAKYEQAAGRILEWFEKATVWTADGQSQHGLFDPVSSTLAMGAEFKNGHWMLQPEHPTDSGGTWTISSLGPEKIDALWGRGAAYQMWRTLRSRAGRRADFRVVQEHDLLAGLDYTDAFPEDESLISPEWTAGGLFALNALARFYVEGAGQGVLTREQIRGMETDRRSMADFIRRQPNAYALGPGHGGHREGQTGFGWYAPPPEVQAMPSIYGALYFDGKADPSAWWRRAQDADGSFRRKK